MKDKSKLYCFVMNIINFSYWLCYCEYVSPYGKTIHCGCKKHDIEKAIK
jgi:hypothetical protein